MNQPVLLVPVQSVACALLGDLLSSTQLAWQPGQVGTNIAPGTMYSYLADMLKERRAE